MVKKRKFAVIITKGEVAFVSYCPQLGVASQGKTVKEAKDNLQEAVELYLETLDKDEILLSKEIFTTSIEVAFA